MFTAQEKANHIASAFRLLEIKVTDFSLETSLISDIADFCSGNQRKLWLTATKKHLASAAG